MDRFMDGKYNRMLDNPMLRLGITSFVFMVWLGVSYGLVRFAG